jgi:ABC-type transport system involved in multi-copper enzyme maturation permease subunit
VITAFSLLFSSFSSPALSALMSFVVFVIGHFSADLKGLANSSGSRSARAVFTALYYLMPNLANYSYITPVTYGQNPTLQEVAAAILYALIYICMILSAATLIFRRRNFK